MKGFAGEGSREVGTLLAAKGGIRENRNLGEGGSVHPEM